ncbi:Prenylated rab acceptor PRA1 [Arabidopsis thaliana x Arabidopsis arenosa]|nr:prenylated RAB acceptor 1.B3 [Arabidopsis thaliana]ANM68242.1 prenylated RAB acceptor 1.B3 [Arabidopsis thaliana]KAG7601257.1 Prenylated rab acceptor PRA1 [Arabidopsis thaliana x Arabidopsis arenosa]|eukprot:NP_001330012.1 prenylated RAB acceptor 1.B3 [Arabidopsis thaliana]
MLRCRERSMVRVITRDHDVNTGNRLLQKKSIHSYGPLIHAPSSHPHAQSCVMMANPPTLPISDHSGGGSQSQQPVSTPAFRTFLSRLSSSIRQSLSQRRPWLELVDRSAISRPESLTDAYSRIRRNLPYFKVNYVTIVSLVLALSLLSHPFSLLVLLCLFCAWIFLYLFRPSDQPLVVLGRTFSDRETLGVLVILTIVVVFLTSVGSLLTSALMIGFGIVCLHGAFRVPEDLFLDDQEPANTGLLSFLSGAATSAAVAAASTPASGRV